MNAHAPIQVRQLAQYARTDAAIPGTVTLMQMGEAGTPYASILTSDLVTSALAAGGNLNLLAGLSEIVFGFDQGAGAVVLSVVQGELQVSPGLRASKVDATFVNAISVTQNGVLVATQADLAADRASSVTSFNQRTGDILLDTADIMRAGGAPQNSPVFSGWVIAPSHWDIRICDDTVVTANWVHRLLRYGAVTSFNCRTGPVTLTTADVNQAYSVPGPPWPTASNPVLGDASNRIATTLFVDESLDDLHATITQEWEAALKEIGSGGHMPVTPNEGSASVVTTGGTAVIAVAAVVGGLNGGYITNPSTAADQGIATAQTLYVDVVNPAILGGYGSTAALSPGQSFTFPAGMTTPVSVNAATSGHRFVSVWW